MELFDNVEYERFFNPLCCRNKRIYYECILELIEKSKTVPLLYELDARDTIVLYFRNCAYAGGFWIHYNLCEISGVNFDMYCMAINQLQEDAYVRCLHKLTENDRIRLQELKNMSSYMEVVNYMLENNVKLEQEIISLELMGVKHSK